MKIDWGALGLVSVISIIATVLFVVLLAGGIRLVAAGLTPAGLPRAERTAPVKIAGYVLLGLAAILVVLGIYLILPFSR